MIGEIAHFLALISALGLILVLIFNAFFYSADRHANQDILSYKLFHQSCLLIFISFGLYIYLAITDDFSISYIANHSNSQLPIFYKITSIWSAHEGSMFLWIVFLTLWSTLFINSISRSEIIESASRENIISILVSSIDPNLFMYSI